MQGDTPKLFTLSLANAFKSLPRETAIINFLLMSSIIQKQIIIIEQLNAASIKIGLKGNVFKKIETWKQTEWRCMEEAYFQEWQQIADAEKGNIIPIMLINVSFVLTMRSLYLSFYDILSLLLLEQSERIYKNRNGGVSQQPSSINELDCVRKGNQTGGIQKLHLQNC